MKKPSLVNVIKDRTITEDKFTKMRFMAFMELEYENFKGEFISVMLVGVDFKEGILTLRPFPDDIYEDKDFQARHEHCRTPEPKPKLSHINGKKQ